MQSLTQNSFRCVFQKYGSHKLTAKILHLLLMQLQEMEYEIENVKVLFYEENALVQKLGLRSTV